jgi:hypothetical protein
MKKIIAALMLTLLVATDLMAAIAIVPPNGIICYKGSSAGDYHALNTKYFRVHISYGSSSGAYYFNCSIIAYYCRLDQYVIAGGCADCPTGSQVSDYSYNTTGYTTCDWCKEGYYRTPDDVCAPCPDGGTTFNEPENNNSITECHQGPSGTYTDDTGTYDLNGWCFYEE